MSFFNTEDFDRLRPALAAHLSEILPERDHRELILNLIHDVKRTATDVANAKRDVEIERLRGTEEYLGTKHDELLTKNTELRKENTRLREALTAIQKSQRWETIYEKARAALDGEAK